MTRALPALLIAVAIPLAQAAGAQTILEPPVATTPAADSTEAAPQISTPHDRRLVEDQVTAGSPAHQPVAQFGGAVRKAQPPQALSEPAAGRTGSVEAVGGKDRCDPQAAKAKQSKICSGVIETRANDYARAGTTELSPEQKLLLTREIQGGGQDVANATQRLGKSGASDDPLEMGIAATVLNQNQPPPAPEKETDPKIDAATQAIINAILVNQTTPH